MGIVLPGVESGVPLWTLSDGTTCVMAEGYAAPCYALWLVRGHHVIREERLYSQDTARVLADIWKDLAGKAAS
jgi:hypothetical protein